MIDIIDIEKIYDNERLLEGLRTVPSDPFSVSAERRMEIEGIGDLKIIHSEQKNISLKIRY